MLVDLFRNTYNDDTDKKQLRNECEWAKRAENFVYLHRKVGNTQLFSIFWYNDVLVLFNLYGRNYKMYLQNSKKLTPPPPPPPPPVYATNDFNWKCGLHIDWVVRTFFFSPFSLLPTPPPRPPLLIPSSPFLPVFPFPIWALSPRF